MWAGAGKEQAGSGQGAGRERGRMRAGYNM